jgi:hypothetical protein
VEAVGSFFSQGLRVGATNLKSPFSAKKEILLIEEEIEQASTLLLAKSFVSYLSDLVEVRLLDKRMPIADCMFLSREMRSHLLNALTKSDTVLSTFARSRS